MSAKAILLSRSTWACVIPLLYSPPCLSFPAAIILLLINKYQIHPRAHSDKMFSKTNSSSNVVVLFGLLLLPLIAVLKQEDGCVSVVLRAFIGVVEGSLSIDTFTYRLTFRMLSELLRPLKRERRLGFFGEIKSDKSTTSITRIDKVPRVMNSGTP